MMRPVVVPLSDSFFTARAIPLLVEIAQRCEVSMHLLDLHETAPAAPAADPQGPPWSGAFHERSPRAIRDSYLESVARQLADVLGSTRVRTAVRDGDPATELTSYARDEGAGLVVIAVEDRDPEGLEATRALAERLARDSEVPVFLVATNRGRTEGTYIAALDGTELARSGLETALTVARISGAGELRVKALPASFVS